MALLNSINNFNRPLAAVNAENLISCEGCSTVALQLSGGYVGTVIVEGTVDGAAWRPIQLYRDGFGFQPTTLASAATGIYYGACSMYQQVRVRVVAFTSGSVLTSMSANAMHVPMLAAPRAADLHARLQTATGTLTLPAAPDLFHYISRVEIKAHVTVATVAAAATGITDITTTNLGSLAWDLTYETLALGRAELIIMEPATPLRSAAGGAATTFVLPATTGILYDAKVSYYVGL